MAGRIKRQKKVSPDTSLLRGTIWLPVDKKRDQTRDRAVANYPSPSMGYLGSTPSRGVSALVRPDAKRNNGRAPPLDPGVCRSKRVLRSEFPGVPVARNRTSRATAASRPLVDVFATFHPHLRRSQLAGDQRSQENRMV